MKKLFVSMVLLLVFTACVDNGVSSTPEQITTPRQVYSYSAEQQESSSSYGPVLFSSSSSFMALEDLTEICDKTAIESRSSFGDLICSNYNSYLTNIIGLEQEDANYCIEIEHCITEKPACNMNMYNVVGASSEYLRSLCASYQAQGNFQNCDCSKITDNTSNTSTILSCNSTEVSSCVEQTRHELAGTGVGRGTGAQKSIESACNCKY